MKKNKIKSEKKAAKTPFYKKKGFKFGAASSVLCIVFVLCIIAVNVLATFVSKRVTYLSLDLSSSKNHTISEENEKYIKAIDKNIDVIFTCTEETYKTEYYQMMSEQYVDSTGGKYYEQTVALIKDYSKLNPKINVKFIDAQTPEFNEYAQKYKDESLYTGDIIVECSFENSAGNKQSKHKILQFADLYVTDSSSSSSSYSYSSYITGSKVETSLTSALYYVSAEQQDKAVVLTGYGCSSIDDFKTLLKNNNYDIEELETLAVSEIPENTNLLVIPAPTKDFSEAEIKKLDTFLLQSGFGKNILYFASSDQPSLPKLEGLLSEWGIDFKSGMVYETDENNHTKNNNGQMIMTAGDTTFTESIGSSTVYFADKIRPMTLGFSQYSNYFTYDVVKSSESAVIKPADAADNWEAGSSSVKGPFTSVAVSTYAESSENSGDKDLESNIIAVASVDFVNSAYNSYSSIGNSDLLISTVNDLCGRETDTYTVSNKVINLSTFQVSAVQSNVIFVITVAALPVIIILFGVIVYVRRKVK